MNNINHSDDMGACPQRATLIDFGLGKLTQVDLEAVASHVAACSTCGKALESVEFLSEDDSVVATLKQCFQRPTPPLEPGCVRMEATAKKLTLSFDDERPTIPLPGQDREERLPLPRFIGAYAVHGRIGRGGMGVVYKAQQLPINRPVALKMILTGAHSGASTLARFRTEGEAIARLHHANVVQIYEFGEHDGLPFFSMEWVDGGNLARKLAQGPLSPREAAQMVQTLAGTVAFAHQCKVVHRDLKPSNILLTGDGIPKIADFGLAKLLDVDEGQTETGCVLGTARYMAPEQAEGRGKVNYEAADVYALGTILYEALTGRPAFKGETRSATLKKVCHADPVPPAHLRSGIPRELEAICLKCLEKRPQERYPSAQSLADDLGRWLRGERPSGSRRRWLPRLRRARPSWAAVTLLGLALSAGLAGVGGITGRVLNDPDRVVKQLEDELASGKSVTLIGPTGKPGWYRIREGEGSTETSLSEDDTFSVSTWSSSCLIELLRRAPESYSLSAWVRHDKSDLAGEVGLYVSHRSMQGTQNKLHVLTQLTLNNHRRNPDFTKIASPRFKALPSPTSVVRLFPHMFLASPTSGPVWDARPSGVEISFPLEARPEEKKWRRLVVTVSPRGVNGRLDDLQPAEVLAEKIETGLTEGLVDLREKQPGEKLADEFSATFESRGAIGLYLSTGSASFRDVEIKPLSVLDQGP